MNDMSYSKWQLMSDVAIEQSIGHYIKKTRQEQRKTQSQIATAANISRSTLSLLERGETVTMKTLIQVLRVLGKLDILHVFNYTVPVSPLAQAKLEHKVKERIRPYKTKQNTTKSDW